jgi:tetratricopeptide (TPR) repeat protein
MAKPLIGKYEQILEKDPGSTVFIELAKALIERGSASRAAEVCKQGVEHNPDSIVGRVLWGKALISSGHPAEAMDQFDKAIAIERDNPQAYNLIGEVLLHKGLFRSALPILRKAVSLQPNDLRVRQWLDQAQRAVTGAPAPAPAPDKTEVDVGAVGDVAPTDPGLEPTVTELSAYTPSETVPGLTDVFRSLSAREEAAAKAAAAPAGAAPAAEPAQKPAETPPSTVVEGLPSLEKAAAGLAAPAPAGQAPAPQPQAEKAPEAPAVPFTDEPSPEAQALAEHEAKEGTGAGVIPGLTGVFQSLETRDSKKQAAQPGAETMDWSVSAAAEAPADGAKAGPAAPEAESPASAASSTEAAGLQEMHAVSEPASQKAAAGAGSAPRAASEEASVQVSPELMTPPPLRRPPSLPSMPKAPPLPKHGLLADLPDADADERTGPGLAPDLSVSQEIPSVVVAREAAEDIAREYERELRAKLLAAPPPTFWRKHWLAISVGGALLVALGLAAAIYAGTRRQNQGNDLITLRTQSYRALAAATPAGLTDAIELADRVLEIAPGDPDALAARAYANAVLFQGFGQEPGRKADALADLERIKASHPGLALAIPYLVASEGAALEDAKAPLLSADTKSLPEGFERAVACSLAGRILLTGGKQAEAIEKLKEALGADPGHVDTLMALADYYFWQSDPEQALKLYGLAKAASPEHVQALLGAVNAELTLDRGVIPADDLEAARKAFQAAEASGKAGWSSKLRADLDLAEGRVLALQGKNAEAVAKLTSGTSDHPERSQEFWAALGSVEARAGQHDKAEAAYRRALAKRPNDLMLQEELARSMIAQGRYLDAIKATDAAVGASANGDDRRLRIVRGLARLELGQPLKAREELAATLRNGKVPAEAAIYVALLDAQAGQRDTARAVLESAAKAAKDRPGLAHAALGRFYAEEGREKEAIAELTLAETDPRDWEGACALGRLQLKAGRFEEARKHLAVATSRNPFHNEARVAFGEALLGLGDATQAQKELDAAIAQAPSATAYRGLARVSMALGNLGEARRNAGLARRYEPRSAELARLTAQIELASGDSAEAIRGLQKAARAAPDVATFCELGETLVKVGDVAQARQAFGVALKLQKGNVRARLGLVNAALPNQARMVSQDSEALLKETETAPAAVKARALALNARVLLALEDKTKAGERAQAAVAADDASADAHLAMALVAKANKETEPSIKELQRVVGLDPTLAEAHLALADSLAKDPEQLSRALAEIQTYLRIAPKGPDAPTAKKYAAVLEKKLGK